MSPSRSHRSVRPRESDPPVVRLLRRAGSVIEEVEDVLATWGLTWGRYDTLRALSQTADDVGVREGIRRFGEGVPRMLDRLEEMGYVRRAPHPTDGRKKIVQLTEEGREAVREATLALESVEVPSSFETEQKMSTSTERN